MPGDTSMLNKVEFAMQVTNSFPLYGNLQLFLCDSNYVVLDSLVSSASSNYLIPMAPVDANGIVNGVNTTVVHFVYDHDRYHRIASRIAHGLARGYLSSSGTNTVQIHTSDYLQLKLAFRFALNVSFVGF